MADIEKVTKGLVCHKNGLCQIDDKTSCPYWECEKDCSKNLMTDALELLKGYKKLKEQLKELQIIENSRVKDCDDACDWEARDYHKGRFDAYSIALAHFDEIHGMEDE